MGESNVLGGVPAGMQSARSDTGLTQADSPPDLKLYKSPEGYHAIMDWYQSVVDQIECPFESLFANTRFGRTHMLASGRKGAPALFLIPGVAGCAPLWRKQLPDFARDFRVYALDIPGQPGLSDPNPPSFLNDDYTHWLTDVMDDLGLRQAHFAGVSVGGWVAMRMGIDAPDRVGKVVMMGPTGVSRARLPVKIWLTRVMKKSKDADALQDDLTAKSVSSKSPGGSFGTFDRQLARAMALCTRHYRVDRSLGIYNEATGKINFGQGLRVLRRFFLAEPKKILRAFARPGLMIFGEHEVLYNPHAVGRKATRLMNDVRVEVVPGAGHAAIYDQPALVNQMIIDYLK
ncbi:MAG: alpha/beta hydrolase [Chromatiales bacterium]|nr:alpha/beta hydrolase [Chromatiales bacterium]